MRYSKIIVVIQARVKSKRLPDKALLKLNGKPSIVRMVNRIKESKLINEIWIATGKCKTNDPLVKLFKSSVLCRQKMLVEGIVKLFTSFFH